MSGAPKTFHVWSGSLRGISVEAGSPIEAVCFAVRANLPCVLTEVIRVSLKPQGKHHLDVYFKPPYEELFPDLFADDGLEIEVGRVTKR